MRIRYTGGRNLYEVSYNRIPHYFTPENNHIADIQDQKVINYIFSLPNRAEFEAVIEPVVEEVKPPIIPKPVDKKVVNKTAKPKNKKGGR